MREIDQIVLERIAPIGVALDGNGTIHTSSPGGGWYVSTSQITGMDSYVMRELETYGWIGRRDTGLYHITPKGRAALEREQVQGAMSRLDQAGIRLHIGEPQPTIRLIYDRPLVPLTLQSVADLATVFTYAAKHYPKAGK